MEQILLLEGLLPFPCPAQKPFFIIPSILALSIISSSGSTYFSFPAVSARGIATTIPYDIKVICKALREREKAGKSFSIIAVIVFGRPITFKPSSLNILADFKDPLPPKTTRQSSPSFR